MASFPAINAANTFANRDAALKYLEELKSTPYLATARAKLGADRDVLAAVAAVNPFAAPNAAVGAASAEVRALVKALRRQRGLNVAQAATTRGLQSRNEDHLDAVRALGTNVVQLTRSALTQADVDTFAAKIEAAAAALAGTPHAVADETLAKIRDAVELLRAPFELPPPAPVTLSKAGAMKLVRNQIANELRKVVEGPVRYPITVEFADGSRYSSHPDRTSEIVFVIKKGAELPLATKGYSGLIDAWVNGDIDIKGHRALRKLMHMTSLGKEGSKLRPLGIAEQWFREVFATNNRYYGQAHDNALYHYGNPTGMFREQLGAVMKYTEGFFGPDKGISLDEAQVRSLEYFARAGMDLVADKTARGETVRWAELGGGWMPQGLYTALNFPNVDYTNIGRTESQNRVGKALIEANGLSDRVRIIEGDARDYGKPEHRHQYDIVHQAGVLEHAGPFELDAWFKGMANAVKPGGYLLMSNMTYPLRDAVFVEAVTGKHFFPGGTMPAEGDLAVCARKYGFELVWEAEMRDDYALTLDRWAESFAAAWDKLAPTDPQFYNEPMRRVWELFLEGSSSSLGSAGHSANLNLRHYVMRMGPSGDGERPSVSLLSDARQPTLDDVLASLPKRTIPKLYDDLPADVRAKLAGDRELASDMRPGVPKPLEPVKNLLRALFGEAPRR